MNEKLKPILKWFGYTRRERRSTFILLIILILVIMIRFSLPVSRESPEMISESVFLAGSAGADLTEDPVTGDSLKPSTYKAFTGRRQVIPVRGSISLNACDSATLEGLPFLGPVLSGRIIKYRNLLGGFVSVYQLKEVYGISDSAFSALAPRFFIDSSLVRKIEINHASFGDLLRHPYLERTEVQGILRQRELNAVIKDISELVENKIITKEKAERVLPYLHFF